MLKFRLDALALILINRMLPDNSPSNDLEKKERKAYSAFTLAELLISLAILGVIATFTIPKIVAAQANSQNIAAVKEVASMLAGARQQAQQEGVLTATTKNSDLTPYMNYVSFDTSGSVIDSLPVYGPSQT